MARRPSAASRKKPTSRATKRSGSRKSTRGKAPKKKQWMGWLRVELALWTTAIAAGLTLAMTVMYIDARAQVRAYLATPPTAAPTTIWSAPIRVRAGEAYPRKDLVADLLQAGYEQVGEVRRPGSFHLRSDAIEVWTSPHGDLIKPQRGTIFIEQDEVTRVKPATGLILSPTILGVTGDLSSRRTPVTLEDISPYMVPALLAIEDARFHTHVGVDPIGIIRALFHNLTSSGVHGGSTLTQQLAKNLFLSPKRTIRRKVREVFFAAALESELDKHALLELYLSEVYLGHSAGMPIYGVEQAARAWFGRASANLSVAEAATIAGAISSPNLASPLQDHARALERRDQVIRRMVYVRALTEQQAESALAAPLATVGHPPNASWRTPWAVAAALEASHGIPQDKIRSNAGHHIYTTIQPHLQRAAATVADSALQRTATSYGALSTAEVALAAVDVDSGGLVAVVGGRNYRKSSFHRALAGWRQVGSTVKPLTTMAALDSDKRLSGGSMLPDQQITRRHDGSTWSPTNYDGRYLGSVSIRRMLEESRNIPAVILAERVGHTSLQTFLIDSGLTRATALPSASLGAFSATAVELAGAYASMPRRGVWRSPHIIASVRDAEGRIIYRARPETTRLTSSRAADLTTHLLQGVVEHGTGRAIRRVIPTGRLGGKTGTTDKGRDAWFAGFDGEKSLVVWVGKDRGTLGLTGAQAAIPVWAGIMDAWGGARGSFTKGSDGTTIPVCRETGLRDCGICETVVEEWFPAGADLPAPCGLFPKRKANKVTKSRPASDD